MLACRKWGLTADRLLLPEHPTPVLLLQANDLRFGAVPHLFAPHTRLPVSLIGLMHHRPLVPKIRRCSDLTELRCGICGRYAS